MRKFTLLLILILSLGLYFFLTRKNLHLIPGNGKLPVIYRSAQPSPADLKKLVAEKGIDTVLILRLRRKNEKWAGKEIKAAKDLGLDLHFCGFPEDSLPNKARMLEILNVLDNAKKNDSTLLIHCRAGADRTGFVAAIAQMYLYGFGFDKAMKSLSWRYGHIPKPNSPIERVLQEYELYSTQMDFRSWVEEYYEAQKIIPKQEQENDKAR